MSVTLFDLQTGIERFDINFWHWGAIVEAIRSLRVLPDERAESLHYPFVGELTAEEARVVAAAIRERLLPTLKIDERLLLDGERTQLPDDGRFYREPGEAHCNYSTNRRVLEKFVAACDASRGFRVS